MEEQKVIEEFQRRRRLYLRKSLPAFLMIIVGFSGCYFLSGGERIVVDVPTEEFLMFFFALSIAGGGIVWWTLLTFKIYRCPACSEVPMGGWFHAGRSGVGFSKGVNMNPDACPKCGVQLK